MKSKEWIVEVILGIAIIITSIYLGWVLRDRRDRPQLSETEIRLILDDLPLTREALDNATAKILELEQARRDMKGE